MRSIMRLTKPAARCASGRDHVPEAEVDVSVPRVQRIKRECAARSGARIGQSQIGRMPISRVQELEEFGGALERNVDVLDHRFGMQAAQPVPARA